MQLIYIYIYVLHVYNSHCVAAASADICERKKKKKKVREKKTGEMKKGRKRERERRSCAVAKRRKRLVVGGEDVGGRRESETAGWPGRRDREGQGSRVVRHSPDLRPYSPSSFSRDPVQTPTKRT